jgi:steroid delta-isomerase-like uncharacterized protein
MNTTPQTDARTPAIVVAEFFDAMARRDIEAAMDLVSDDIVEDLAGVGVITGLAEERAFLTAFFGSFPDMQTEVVRVTADGRVVAVEWRRRGTFSGSPWQGLPASGRSFDLRGAAFVEVDDGLISYITAYSDSAQLGRDLGILPPAGSPAERIASAIYHLRVRHVRRALQALRETRS